MILLMFMYLHVKILVISKFVSTGDRFLQPINIVIIVNVLLVVLLHFIIKLPVFIFYFFAAQFFMFLLFCWIGKVYNAPYDTNLISFSLIDKLTKSLSCNTLPLTLLSCNDSWILLVSHLQIICNFVELLLAAISCFSPFSKHFAKHRLFDTLLAFHKDNSFLPLSNWAFLNFTRGWFLIVFHKKHFKTSRH